MKRARSLRVRVVLLVVLALAQMAGDVLSVPGLKGLAAATGASPAPRVFSAAKGLETYSTRFSLEWREADGSVHRTPITPAVAARMRGPYNRRNVYGAALAYGPVLDRDGRTRPMLEAVLGYALCEPGTMLDELGIDRTRIAGPVRVTYEPLPFAGLDAFDWTLEAPCR